MTPQQRFSLLSLASAAIAMSTAHAQTYNQTVLHSFAPAGPNGAYPLAGVIRDAAGNTYGTTSRGGAWDQGVVYKVDTAGHATALYSFTGGADGSSPVASVIRDPAGNLYGTTAGGGTGPGRRGGGVAFKLDTAGHETVLHAFAGGVDGKAPFAGLVRDAAGNLYGTTHEGGLADCGVIFKVDPSGVETVLYTFPGGNQCADPEAGVILDTAGNLYGTTYSGGANGHGSVYKLDTAGHFTTLYNFTGMADGGSPKAGVIRDSAGNFYGTTASGGVGYGVVYKVNPSGQETVLYTFTGEKDGSRPVAGVVLDAAGNLYGTTPNGGAGYGVVFKLDPAGNETVLCSYIATDQNFYAGVILDPSGDLYGTAALLGTDGNYYCGDSCGVVYKLDSAGQVSILYSFPDGTDGRGPFAAVTRDSAGNLYGAVVNGGASNAGVVYKLDPAGHETVLYTFPFYPGGASPFSSLILDPAGNLYGTTASGGTYAGNCYALNGCGVVFKLNPAGQETTLYTFTGPDGSNPYSTLIADSEGNFYGTTDYGGAGNCDYYPVGLQGGCGVVFKLTPSGQETVLYSFTGGADGRHPVAGVVRDSAGNLYGTTYYGGSGDCHNPTGDPGCGVVFKLDTSGQETVVYSFTGGADGALPNGVILDLEGNLYGTTFKGGDLAGECRQHGCGVVFKLDPSGQETVLYSFTGGADGSLPQSGVILDSPGNIYGTTGVGGPSGRGVVYKLNPDGQETVLYGFTGYVRGYHPVAGLTLDPAGNLYGAATGGGKQDSGVIFKLAPQ